MLGGLARGLSLAPQRVGSRLFCPQIAVEHVDLVLESLHRYAPFSGSLIGLHQRLLLCVNLCLQVLYLLLESTSRLPLCVSLSSDLLKLCSGGNQLRVKP